MVAFSSCTCFNQIIYVYNVSSFSPLPVCAHRGFLKGKADGAKINLIAGNFTKQLPKTR